MWKKRENYIILFSRLDNYEYFLIWGRLVVFIFKHDFNQRKLFINQIKREIFVTYILEPRGPKSLF